MTPPDQGQIQHINLANNQVSHNTKIKSGKEIRKSNPPSSIPKYSGTAPSGAMGRRDGKSLSSKKNSIQYSLGNEENGYPVPDLNK
jgi:hypothetical protein